MLDVAAVDVVVCAAARPATARKMAAERMLAGGKMQKFGIGG